MSFLNPTALWGLLLLIIPILLHFFSFRRVIKVNFSSIQFLQNVKEEQGRRNNLKKWIILISRLAALTGIILAFAQPTIGKNNSDSKQLVLIVDNSKSMESQDHFNEAISNIVEFIQAHPIDYKFQLIANDITNPEYLSKQQAIKELTNLRTLNSKQNLKDLLLKVNTKGGTNTPVYIFTDGQKNFIGTEDSLENVNFRWFPHEEQAQVFIDSVWIEGPMLSPGRETSLFIRSGNVGNKNITGLQLQLSIGDQLLNTKTIEIPSGKEIVQELEFSIPEKSILEMNAALKSNTGLALDTYPICYNTRNKANVAIVLDSLKDNPFEVLLNINDFARAYTMRYDNLNPSELEKADFIILQQSTRNTSFLNKVRPWLDQGKSILVFVDENAPELSSLDINLTTVSNNKLIWNMQDPLLRPVTARDLNEFKSPVVQSSPSLSSTSSWNTLVSNQNGQTLVGYKPYSKGSLYISTLSFKKNRGSFSVADRLFPVMITRITELSITSNPLAYFIGDKAYYMNDSLPTGNMARIKNKEITREIEVLYRNAKPSILLSPGLYQSANFVEGFYSIESKETLLDKIALVESRIEKKSPYLSKAELTEIAPVIDNLTDLKEIALKGGSEFLWKWFIFAAILFLIVESILIKLLK